MAGFPIFVEFGNRPPLVVGGSALACAKVTLLLKRAEIVDVFAANPTAELLSLQLAGKIAIHDRRPSEADIRGRPLVISANGDDAEDGLIFSLAQSLGVPINVPDRPAMSTFSLAAIVDRGTVMIAIGTEGAAPVLATQLRSQMEHDLHPRLGRLADIAREYRHEVSASVPAGSARRKFWADFFTGPAAQAILSGDEPAGRALLQKALASVESDSPPKGRVILVGAGPGDPDLLTIKAVRALKTADVIVHDGLMGHAVLDYARREAEIISVGKSKGRHSRTQGEINGIILSHARSGKIVVRLKGGDPSIFGRGGEEIDVLRASGIQVDVIPGVTAATAVAASLQIPLTHRDISRSVTFISGHAAGNGGAEFDQVDFKSLANSRATLVVYMGLSTSGDLAKRLIEDGWVETTPVLAVSRVSQPEEQRVSMTLQSLARSHQAINLTGPTLLIIGEVASLDVAGVVRSLAATIDAPSEGSLA